MMSNSPKMGRRLLKEKTFTRRQCHTTRAARGQISGSVTSRVLYIEEALSVSILDRLSNLGFGGQIILKKLFATTAACATVGPLNLVKLGSEADPTNAHGVISSARCSAGCLRFATPRSFNPIPHTDYRKVYSAMGVCCITTIQHASQHASVQGLTDILRLI